MPREHVPFLSHHSSVNSTFANSLKSTDPRPRNCAVLMEESLPEKKQNAWQKNTTLPFEIVWIPLTNVLICQAHHGLPLSSSTTSPSSSCRKSWDVDRSWLVDGIGHIGDYAGQLCWGLKYNILLSIIRIPWFPHDFLCKALQMSTICRFLFVCLFVWGIDFTSSRI